MRVGEHRKLYLEENLPEKHRERLRTLKALNLKLARAWAVNETLNRLWAYVCRGSAEPFFRRWTFWATHSRLAPIIQMARIVKTHLRNLLTYFAGPVTNAMAEGINAKVQAMKRMARDFRNLEHLKTAILFHCGGLQLHPATRRSPG